MSGAASEVGTNLLATVSFHITSPPSPPDEKMEVSTTSGIGRSTIGRVTGESSLKSDGKTFDASLSSAHQTLPTRSSIVTMVPSETPTIRTASSQYVATREAGGDTNYDATEKEVKGRKSQDSRKKRRREGIFYRGSKKRITERSGLDTKASLLSSTNGDQATGYVTSLIKARPESESKKTDGMCSTSVISQKTKQVNKTLDAEEERPSSNGLDNIDTLVSNFRKKEEWTLFDLHDFARECCMTDNKGIEFRERILDQFKSPSLYGLNKDYTTTAFVPKGADKLRFLTICMEQLQEYLNKQTANLSTKEKKRIETIVEEFKKPERSTSPASGEAEGRATLK